jgi:rare lipoprotein A
MTNFKTILFGFVLTVILSGCSSGPYEGYKYKPYKVRGQHYEPIHPPFATGFTEEGIASHFDESWLFFFPGKSALGENQWPWSKAAAHKTLPLPCRIRITNLKNGRQTVVRVNDRGPFIDGRVVDVTPPVAKELGFHEAGLAPVRIEVVSVGDGRYRIR